MSCYYYYYYYYYDSQLYISLKVSTQQNIIEKIENFIKDVKTWMSSNFLVLNDSKLKSYTSLHDSLHTGNFLPPMLAKQLSNLHLKLEIWGLCLISTWTWSNMSTIYVVVLPLLWARLENCGNTLIRSPHRNSFRHLSSAGLTFVTLFFTVFQRKTSVKFIGSKTWPLAWFSH